jgi:heme exporter protein A
MLEASNLECVRGEKSLFRGLSFRLEPGACLMVQGANGSGKTSLLRMICGLAQPEQGEIRWEGQSIRKLAEDYRGELLYCGHAGAVKDDLTALENARISATLAGTPVDDDASLQALRQLGLKGREHLPARVLSAGQKRRVALSRLLLEKRKLWVLDEPLTALDKAAVTNLCSVIDAHLAAGGMAVLTSHQDLPLAAGRVEHLRLD